MHPTRYLAQKESFFQSTRICVPQGMVNPTPLLLTPFTVTTTSPVVVAGTRTEIWVEDQDVTTAVTPLKVTKLDPCVSPKPAPLMSTVSPGSPQLGLTSLTNGVSGDGVGGIGRLVQPKRRKGTSSPIRKYLFLIEHTSLKGRERPIRCPYPSPYGIAP